MSDAVTLHDLAPSSNSRKVRVALGYKDIPYTKVPVAAADRDELVRVSGQPLAPVLVHDGRVIFDSAAILRYLDANFRSTPPLYSADRDEMRSIERWEMLGRTEIGEPGRMVFAQFRAPERSPDVIEQARELLRVRTRIVEEALAAGPWLVGGRMTAADVTVASSLFLASLDPAAPPPGPVAAFFADTLQLGPGRERTRAWVRAVTAWDR